MAYETYKDANGVTWRTYWTAKTAAAYPDGDITYGDQPPDISVPRNKHDPDGGTFDSIINSLSSLYPGNPDVEDAAAVGEADRETFMRLREKIDEYASAHKGAGAVVLTVRPSKDKSSTALIVAIAIAVALLARRR